MFSSFSWQLFLSLACLLGVQAQNYTGQISPPYSPAQIMSIGDINAVTLDDPSDFLSGGTITVDGILYVVPRYSMLTTPNQVVAWSELWENGTVQMPRWPELTWEASIFANEVNGSLICGMAFIQQASARIITGFINHIDTETGNFFISGSSAEPGTGITARLNDPIGRYGLPYPDNPLWAADTENPSITSISAMPLCIQRPFGNLTDDPLCPTKNRPKRNDGTAHTMLNFLPEAQRTEDDPDPNFFVPMAVGDYVTVLGTIVDDDVLAVFNLIANLGIFTPPGEQPTYMYIDRGQYAITGPAASETGETRAVVFTTDPTTPITWSAVDLDPCTGAMTWRDLLTEAPLANLAGQQPGKTVFRGGKLDFSPAPRWIGFKTASGMKVTNNSIVAGVYINPVNGFANGYIFAEVTVYGDQMFALEFNDMDFIAKGSGPYVEGVPLKTPMMNPPIMGQLDPWPGTTPPTPVVCDSTPTTPGNGTATGTSTPSTPPQPRDEVTITSVTFVRTRGEDSYTVQAVSTQTTEPFAVLTLTGEAVNPVGEIIMTNLGNGLYQLIFSSHTALNSITVVSSLGGSATWTP